MQIYRKCPNCNRGTGYERCLNCGCDVDNTVSTQKRKAAPPPPPHPVPKKRIK